MLKRVVSLLRCGVFQDYQHAAELPDFGEFNVIYGWNYSGKTTFSRVLSCLERKGLHPGFAGAALTVLDDQGQSINESNIDACNLHVRVFNTDFIAKNLRWDGTSFDPILLLGQDSVRRQRHISRLARLERKLEDKSRDLRSTNDLEAERVAEAKSSEARQIKTTVKIVEAFGATQLDKVCEDTSLDSKSELSDEAFDVELQLARTSADSVAPKLEKISVTPELSALFERARALIKQTPHTGNAIAELVERPAIASWVEHGLELHKNSDTCEFCEGKLAESRRERLRQHFSDDAAALRDNLRSIWNDANLQIGRLSNFDPHPKDFASQLGVDAERLIKQLKNSVAASESWIEHAKGVLNEKIKAPYSPAGVMNSPDATENHLKNTVQAVNQLIDRHNLFVEEFVTRQRDSVTLLKRHMAYRFLQRENIVKRISDIDGRKEKALRFDAQKEKVARLRESEQAHINQAEKGRERLNEKIATFLGSELLQIGVVGGVPDQKFKLTRDGQPATNLSEGEKTAIAFSYFLTKLEEVNLSESIVVIDDPISSLDSNHIFQIAGYLKANFFKLVPQTTGSPKWMTTCKQLFVLTHNFEFFTLLRDMPRKSFAILFHTRRIHLRTSTFTQLPVSIAKYSSEYHYTFQILHEFYHSADKNSFLHLLSIPNAARRFLELYTYSRLPFTKESTVDQRTELLFGSALSTRITKLLHHFSHLQSVERMSRHSDLVVDIEAVVSELMDKLSSTDKPHFDALLQSVS